MTSLPLELPTALSQLIQSIEHDTPTSPAALRDRLQAADISMEELRPWFAFDHPTVDSYGRKLIYQGDRFEVMLMSWNPGDFSAIHDHGYTQWGAVQVFGPAEHATFSISDSGLQTLRRWTMASQEVVGVAHTLIHQMGNASETAFVSLHIYGCHEETDAITADARLFDPVRGIIQHVDGGVFFALPGESIAKTLAGPKGDLPTQLRYQAELTQRLYKIARHSTDPTDNDHFREAQQQLGRLLTANGLEAELRSITDSGGHYSDSRRWTLLHRELRAASAALALNKSLSEGLENFHRYAAHYDALIGEPCLRDFMAGYWSFLTREYKLQLSTCRLLSVGCGTGLVESHLSEQYGIPQERILGIDASNAMVAYAQKRIPAQLWQVENLDQLPGIFDLIYSGLNVLQYLPAALLPSTIAKIANKLTEKGCFVGDFITPDHMRWYPNLLRSDDGRLYSLRTPRLVEKDGISYQESDIVNVEIRTPGADVRYTGQHRRHLVGLFRLRKLFEQYFQEVSLYDAVSLQPIPESAGSCPSTRLLVVAFK